MSNYIAYKLEDNLKRKSNNTSEELGWGKNNNVKSYSTKPGQLSAKSQAQILNSQIKNLNKNQPVKHIRVGNCPVVQVYMKRKLGLVA